MGLNSTTFVNNVERIMEKHCALVVRLEMCQNDVAVMYRFYQQVVLAQAMVEWLGGCTQARDD